MQKEITVDEWRAELDRLEREQPNQDGFTTAELAAALGKSINGTRQMLKKLILSGAIETVTVTRRNVLNGVNRPVPGFRRKKSKGRK